jgi:hypothetical protein
MPRAILRDGVIYPLEPLPSEWEDGREVWVEDAPAESPEAFDRWSQEMKDLCATGSPEDDDRLQAAIDELRARDKEMARREMGLHDAP